jgi:hypothetical protein
MATGYTIPVERQPYGLPMGTIRGFMSVLICLFFWIVLLYPFERPPTVPLAHFFLLTLVLMAFASHPVREIRMQAFLPWLMRVIFVGGSIAVVVIALVRDPNAVADRLTPNASEISQWPVLLACIAGGFGSMLLLRSVIGPNNDFFQSVRAWVGVIAMLLLFFEIIFQFLIRPNMSDVPSETALKVWEGIIVGFVAAYFGSRA